LHEGYFVPFVSKQQFHAKYSMEKEHLTPQEITPIEFSSRQRLQSTCALA
jgi:hypothetical protein